MGREPLGPSGQEAGVAPVGCCTGNSRLGGARESEGSLSHNKDTQAHVPHHLEHSKISAVWVESWGPCWEVGLSTTQPSWSAVPALGEESVLPSLCVTLI